MTKMSYLEWIEMQMAIHEKKIAALTIARDVIIEMQQKASPDDSKAPPKSKAKAIRRKQLRNAAEVRGRIVEALTTLGKSSAMSEITDYICTRAPDIAPKRIWNSVYQMRVKGDLVRDERGRYSLPASATKAA